VKYYIAGFGGHAKMVYQIAQENRIKINGFLDIPLKNKSKAPKSILGLPIVNITSVKVKSVVFIGLGDNEDRTKTYSLLKKKKFELPYLISKNSLVHKTVKIGSGTIIFTNVTININAVLKNNIIINTGSIIEHEVLIKNNVNISPGSIICGKSIIGENTFIGAGSIVQQNIIIGKNCLIGSGSNVISNIKNKNLVYGNPAKIRWLDQFVKIIK